MGLLLKVKSPGKPLFLFMISFLLFFIFYSSNLLLLFLLCCVNVVVVPMFEVKTYAQAILELQYEALVRYERAFGEVFGDFKIENFAQV